MKEQEDNISIGSKRYKLLEQTAELYFEKFPKDVTDKNFEELRPHFDNLNLGSDASVSEIVRLLTGTLSLAMDTNANSLSDFHAVITTQIMMVVGGYKYYREQKVLN